MTTAGAEPADDTAYTEHALRGAAWQGAVNVSIRVLRAIVFLLLARLIAPEAFGLVALATVFVVALQFVSGAGLSSAVIHVRELTRAHLDTAFWLGTATGAVLSACLAGLAGGAATWFATPGIDVVLLGLAVMPFLSGVTMVPEGVLSRELRFRALSLRHVAAASVSVALAVGLAVAGAGVWALVAQTVGEAVVSAVALWSAMRGRYRPGLQVTRSALRDLVPFSTKVVGGNLTQLVSIHGDDFLVGIVLGPAALGLYSVAYRLMSIVQESMLNVSANVAFPVYSRLRDDPVRLAAGFRRAARLVLAVTGPVYLAVGLASTTVVQLTLGPAWSAAAPTMTVLALGGIATTVIETVNVYLQAVGQAGRVFALSVAGTAANVVGFAVAVRFGILWVAVAFTARAVLLAPITLWQARTWTGGTARAATAYGALLPSLAVVAVGALSVGRAGELWGTVPALAVVVPTTAAAYLVALRLTARDVLEDLGRLATTALPLDRVLPRVLRRPRPEEA